MNILFSQYTADHGNVEVFGHTLAPGNPRAALDAGVGMVHQHFTLAGDMTVQENITLGVQPLFSLRSSASAARERIVSLSERFQLKVDSDAQVGTLSVGERQRAEILKALYRDVKILILDEPTAVLAPQETDDFFATLKKAIANGLSNIFISHKLHEVMAVSNRVVVLRHGKLVGEAETTQTDPKAISAMMMGASASPPQISTAKPGAVLMQMDHVNTPNIGNAPGLKNVSLGLRAGQVTGLAGVSGNGQAALADLVGGMCRPVSSPLTLNDKQPPAGHRATRSRKASHKFRKIVIRRELLLILASPKSRY